MGLPVHTIYAECPLYWFDRPEGTMDPLSDVLSLLKPQSYVSGGFSVDGDLSIQFPQHQGIKCYAVLSGQCWLSVEGVPEPVRLTSGDCFLLPRGMHFSLSTNLALTPVDYRVLLAARLSGDPGPPSENRGRCIVGGHFLLIGGHADILLKSLPPIVHIRKESDKAAMRWSIERMREELHDPQPGGSLITQQLAYMMIIQALRLHLADTATSGVGWLFALADKQMGAASACIHNDPARCWTLQELAESVGMSRSIFALRFKETVGSTPMEYLTRWRMLLAGQRLNTSGDSISVLASSLGYESESAFGKAFKRVMGCSPRQYSRSRGLSLPSPRGSEAAHAGRLELVAS
jgi:AraC-like DNA-binding protein